MSGIVPLQGGLEPPEEASPARVVRTQSKQPSTAGAVRHQSVLTGSTAGAVRHQSVLTGWNSEHEEVDAAAREAYADKVLAEVAEEGIVPIHGLAIIPRAVLWVALATHPTVRFCDLMHEHDKWYKLLAHAESHVRLYGTA